MDKKKLIIYISLTILCVFILLFGAYFALTLSNKEKAPVYYKQGLEYYRAGDYQDAYYNFSKIIPASPLYFNGVYRSAKSADMLEDNKTALRKYAILATFTKDKNITPFALWRIANINFDMENYKKAKSALLKLNKKYPETEYGIASNYLLSKIEDDPIKKKTYLINYLKDSACGRFAKEITEEIFKDKKLKFSSEDKIILANALYENGDYRRAVGVLRKVPIELSWVNLIKALDKLNSSNNVVKVGKRGLAQDNGGFSEEELEEAISVYIKHSTRPADVVTKEIYDNTQDKRIKGIALYKNSAYSTGAELLRKEAKFYENYPTSMLADKVLFNLFMENLTAGKNTYALKYAKKYLSGYKDREKTPCILYFTALLKRNSSDKSYMEEVERLSREYPNSYYTYRAYANLVKSDLKAKRDLKISEKTKIDFPKSIDKQTAKFFENFVAMGDIAAFDDFRINDLVIKSWLEYKKGNRALSSVIARDYISKTNPLPKRSHPIWKLAYPIYYEKEINSVAADKNLNPYLFLALIKEESHFDPDIRSAVGATGLTQIMPATAQMVAGRAYTPFELTDTDLNITLGGKYFAYLMDVFSGDEPLCVLSYNSGPNAVKKWLALNKNVTFDIMIEKIPYNETKGYIKKVYSAYWNYLLTYEGIKI